MNLKPLRTFFNQLVALVRPTAIGEVSQPPVEQQAPCYGGRFYHTVTLPAGKTFADLEATFKDINFVPQPRVRIGDAFIGSGYVADEEKGTARILAAKDVAQSLSAQGYLVSLEVPRAQPATLKYR